MVKEFRYNPLVLIATNLLGFITWLIVSTIIGLSIEIDMGFWFILTLAVWLFFYFLPVFGNWVTAIKIDPALHAVTVERRLFFMMKTSRTMALQDFDIVFREEYKNPGKKESVFRVIHKETGKTKVKIFPYLTGWPKGVLEEIDHFSKRIQPL